LTSGADTGNPVWVYVLVGGLAGAVAVTLIDRRRRRRSPEFASLSRVGRLRHNWRASRYSPAGWIGWGVLDLALGGLVLAVLGGDQPVLTAASCVLFLALATASFVQAARSRGRARA
jgi:hypothetical protein